jgi:hypothetical protein
MTCTGASPIALADRIELWPIDRLRPYERNPRTHSEANDQAKLSPSGFVCIEYGLNRLVSAADETHFL